MRCINKNQITEFLTEESDETIYDNNYNITIELAGGTAVFLENKTKEECIALAEKLGLTLIDQIMECEIYEDLLLVVFGISAVCAMLIMVYFVYKKNKQIMEWIKIKDKLPKFKTDVLCFCSEYDGEIAIGQLDQSNYVHTKDGIDSQNDWSIYSSIGEMKCYHVTHWMPLPKAPK